MLFRKRTNPPARNQQLHAKRVNINISIFESDRDNQVMDCVVILRWGRQLLPFRQCTLSRHNQLCTSHLIRHSKCDSFNVDYQINVYMILNNNKL